MRRCTVTNSLTHEPPDAGFITVDPEDSGRPQMHVSAVYRFAKCGINYQNYYPLGIRNRGTAPMFRGTSVDASVTENLGRKVAGEPLMPVEQVVQVARDRLTFEWDQGVTLGPGESAQEVYDKTVDEVTSLARFHAEEIAPTIEPVAVARQFAITIEGLPFDLVGTMDIQTADEIIDTKAKAKSPSADESHRSLQGTAYMLASRALDPEPASRFVLHNLVALKRGPKLVAQPSTRVIEDYSALLRRLELMQRSMETGLYQPATPDAWWCASKYCEYSNTCPYINRPVTVAVGGGGDE